MENIKTMTKRELSDYLRQLEERATVNAAKIKAAEARNNTSEAEGLASLLKAIDTAITEARAELDSREDEPQAGQKRGGGFDPVKSYGFRSVASYEMSNGGQTESRKEGGKNPEEVRAFQNFILKGARNISETEARALTVSGAAAVIPVDIYDKLITDGKYSDLLHRATVINNNQPGNIYIPIASGASAYWKTENEAGTETAPTLSKLALGGNELMALMKMSVASASLSYGGFESAMLDLLSAEVIEKLEYSFINGTGTDGDPVKGLAALSWTDSNTVTDALVNRSIAAGIAKLPQRYARNAVLLMNANTAYATLAAADDSNGAPIFSPVEMPNKIFGREVVISEHCPDSVIYIVDPRELYVRFAMPLQVETDGSEGFSSAQIAIRALTVVDAVWNAAACVKVTTA